MENPPMRQNFGWFIWPPALCSKRLHILLNSCEWLDQLIGSLELKRLEDEGQESLRKVSYMDLG